MKDLGEKEGAGAFRLAPLLPTLGSLLFLCDLLLVAYLIPVVGDTSPVWRASVPQSLHSILGAQYQHLTRVEEPKLDKL